MIEIKFIPDGIARVPPEATDHNILASHMKANVDLPDQADAPIDGWRQVRKVVPGHGNYVALQVPGEPPDYPGNTLEAIANSIVDNVDGIKRHPQGWQYVSEPY